jgi:energy-converting hydrogenase Eha subunit C
MHDCIVRMLKTQEQENIECLVKLLETIGVVLESNPRNKVIEMVRIQCTSVWIVSLCYYNKTKLVILQ